MDDKSISSFHENPNPPLSTLHCWKKTFVVMIFFNIPFIKQTTYIIIFAYIHIFKTSFLWIFGHPCTNCSTWQITFYKHSFYHMFSLKSNKRQNTQIALYILPPYCLVLYMFFTEFTRIFHWQILLYFDSIFSTILVF